MFDEHRYHKGKFMIDKSPRIIHKLIFTLSELTRRMGTVKIDDLIQMVISDGERYYKEKDAELQ